MKKVKQARTADATPQPWPGPVVPTAYPRLNCLPSAVCWRHFPTVHRALEESPLSHGILICSGLLRLAVYFRVSISSWEGGGHPQGFRFAVFPAVKGCHNLS